MLFILVYYLFNWCLGVNCVKLLFELLKIVIKLLMIYLLMVRFFFLWIFGLLVCLLWFFWGRSGE